VITRWRAARKRAVKRSAKPVNVWQPILEEAHAWQKTGCLYTFFMVGSGDAFLGLLAATVPHTLAAIGGWFSTSDLNRIDREIEPIDFSKRRPIGGLPFRRS
jgi:hypothetical protein